MDFIFGLITGIVLMWWFVIPVSSITIAQKRWWMSVIYFTKVQAWAQQDHDGKWIPVWVLSQVDYNNVFIKYVENSGKVDTQVVDIRALIPKKADK